MADNFATNAGSGGNTFASDDIASVHYPRVKISWGVDGAAVDASATNPFPVDIISAIPAGSNNIGDVDVLTLPAATNAGATAKTADFDTGAGTDTVTMFGIALPASGGAVAGGTSTNPVRTDPTGTTTQPVSGTVTANAGSGTFTVSGTVTANLAAGSNNIGDVDVLSVIPGTGATSLGKAIDGVAGATDTGVASLAVRDDALAALTPIEGDWVPLRVDANGALWVIPSGTVTVDGSGVTQPVSGTVTANAGSGTFTVSGTVTANAGSGTFTVDSELPAAAALADATANPTVPLVGAALEIFNGTTWDRVRGDTTNGIDVDVTRLPALAAGTNNIGDVDVLSVIPGTGATALGKAEDAAHTTGDTGVYALAVRDDSPAAHSGTDGDYESLHVNAEGGLWTSPTPSASGGLSIFRSLDLDETEEDVKTTAGTVYGWYIANLATTTRYVKFYNDTAANVAVGTTTPLLTLPIPGNSTDDIAANALGAHGIAFSTAICVAATTGLADADTGAPGANDVVINLFYK